MSLKFKYQEHFSKNGLTSCPPVEYTPSQRSVYRWCIEPLEEEKNFMPQAIKMEKKLIPPRRNAKPAKMCEDYAISLFDTANNAKKAFKGLPSHIKPKLGYTHLSKTNIIPCDGVMSAIEGNGHFNFHESAESTFLERCEITDVLS